MAMNRRAASTVTVKIAELKNRLSDYLRRVQRGETVLVCHRDRVIARIERAGPSERVVGEDAAWLDRLEQRGVIRRGGGRVSPKWLASGPRVNVDAVGAVLRERDEGR